MVRFRKTLLVLAAPIALVLLALLLRRPFVRTAAEHWREQMEHAPTGQVESLAGRLTQLGPPGIRALVDALGSDREVVAAASRRVLWAELARWETLPVPTITENLAVLAESLAEHAKDFRPAARRDATELAGEVLRWWPQSGTARGIEVIDHCGHVLELAAIDQVAVDSIAASGTMSAAHKSQASSVALTGPGMGPGRPALETPDMSSAVSPLPGGELPVDALPGSQPQVSMESSPTADRRSGERHDSSSRAGDSQPPLQTPQELYVPGRVRPLSVSEPAPPPATSVLQIVRSENDAANQVPAYDEELAKTETDVLMRWLHAEDPSVASRAEAELRRRSFTDVHLELARRLFDPDPAVRIELARTLPKLTSVNPVPWLLWLSRDPRNEVRLAAISLMATTGDPELLARIRQMASEDSDAAVQRVAERLEKR